MVNDYLAHYGIKGMKWGVRRYETTNGHLTEEGKLRYGSKHGLKKAIRKEMRTAQRNSDEAIMRRYAVEGAERIAKKAEEKYAKTQKEKHRIRAEAAKQNVEYQKQKVAEAEKTRREHYNRLVKEFGKTAVEKISYTDDERSRIAHDAQVAALWSVGVTVPSMKEMGYSYANADYGSMKRKLKKAQK